MSVAPWSGELEVGDGWARWRGVPGDAALHAHSAAQAVLGPCEMHDGAGHVLRADAVLVEPMAPHRVRAERPVALLFVEPWMPAAALPRDVAAPLLALPHDTPVLAAPAASGWWRAWRAAPTLEPAADAWASAARAFIESRLADGRVELADLARHLHLSADHARHRFAAATGLPFKRYVLWRRLRLATLALQRGADATYAAHEAGFADSAHLARTLKALFGVTITQALRRA